MRQQQQRTRQIIIQSSRRGRGARPTLILFLGARAPRPRRARKTNKNHSNQENKLYTIGGLFLFICLLQIGTGARGARHKQTQSPNVLTWGCTNANVQNKNANAREQNKHAKLRVFCLRNTNMCCATKCVYSALVRIKSVGVVSVMRPYKYTYLHRCKCVYAYMFVCHLKMESNTYIHGWSMRTPPRAREQSPVQPNLDRARRSHENQQNARKGFDRTKKQENMRIRFEIIKNIKINRKTFKSKQNARREQNRTGDLFLCHGSVTDVSRECHGTLLESSFFLSQGFRLIFYVFI